MSKGAALDLSLEGREYRIILLPNRRAYLRHIRGYAIKGKRMSGRGSRAQYVPMIVRQPGHFSGVIHFNAEDAGPEIVAHECFHLCFHHVGRFTALRRHPDKEERLATILGQLVQCVTDFIERNRN
jgi:hypothetical protein